MNIVPETQVETVIARGSRRAGRKAPGLPPDLPPDCDTPSARRQGRRILEPELPWTSGLRSWRGTWTQARRHIRVIPEWFGGGALPRKELKQAAAELTAGQAGLIAVGEPTVEKALDQALAKAGKVVKHTVDASTDEITSELQEALKS